MKRILTYTFSSLILALGLSACNLEETPKDQIGEEEAFQNSSLVYLNTVATLYNEIGGGGGSQGLGGPDRGIYDLNTITSDEAIIPKRGSDWEDGGLWMNLYQHKWSVDNAIIKGSWDYLYRVIGKVNGSLDKLASLNTEGGENNVIPTYQAELRAFRAMFYYYLLDLFGNVPLVVTSEQKISDVKQSPRSEVFGFVVKELTESLPLLNDANSSKPGRYYGRITKPVAYFLLAKLALNSKVYADDNWADGVADGEYTFKINDTSMDAWTATIYFCDKITEMGYKLEPNYLQNFAVKNESSVENIFVIPMEPGTYNARNMMMVRSRHYEHGKAFSQDGWNGTSLTKEGLQVFRKGKEDPRLELSFFTGKVQGPDGKFVQADGKDLEYKPDAIALDVSNTPNEKLAGARWKKYELDNTAESAGQLVHNDYVLFRYADVLLMRSEALVRQGKSGDADLNAVRERVGAGTRVANLQNILDERLMELNWEGHRRQDLIRFGQYNKAISDRPASDPSRTVFPIPAEVLSLNPKLSQNPGY